MSTYFSNTLRQPTPESFSLRRYKDNHGKFYEIRKGCLPRGSVYRRLMDLEWKAHCKSIDKILEEFKTFANGVRKDGG